MEVVESTTHHLSVGAYSAIKFSSSRCGLLATMARDAAQVQFWDL
jgi:hypothetical protein